MLPLRAQGRGLLTAYAQPRRIVDSLTRGRDALALANHGLDLSLGTLTGALQALAPTPLVDAMLTKLRIERHWHADETPWAHTRAKHLESCLWPVGAPAASAHGPVPFHAAQFANRSPGTRLFSRVLFVTSGTPSAWACAAIRLS